MSTVILPCDVTSAAYKAGAAAFPESTNIAGTNGPVRGMAFNDSAQEDLYFDIVLGNFGASNTVLTATFQWYSRTGATTGAADWGCDLARIATGTSVEAVSFATTVHSASTVSATAKGGATLAITTVVLPASLATNDGVFVHIYRNGAAAGDTLVGDAVLARFFLSYSDS